MTQALSRIDYAILLYLGGISGALAVWYGVLRKQLNLFSLKSFFFFVGLTFVWFLILSLSSLVYIPDARWNFVFVAMLSLVGGIAFARVMFVNRDVSMQNLQTDVLLTFFLCTLGMTVYYLGYSAWSAYIIEPIVEEGDVVEKSKLGLFAAFACLPFVVPFFVQLSYQILHRIPTPIYPKWYYPVDKEIPPFIDRDPQTKISLHFSTKEEGGELFTRITLIPNEMILGEFIHIYFGNWNENQETSMAMELTDYYGKPYALRFYVSPKDNLEKKRRLDPNKTALYNKLKNEDIIQIERENRLA